MTNDIIYILNLFNNNTYEIIYAPRLIIVLFIHSTVSIITHLWHWNPVLDNNINNHKIFDFGILSCIYIISSIISKKKKSNNVTINYIAYFANYFL